MIRELVGISPRFHLAKKEGVHFFAFLGVRWIVGQVDLVRFGRDSGHRHHGRIVVLDEELLGIVLKIKQLSLPDITIEYVILDKLPVAFLTERIPGLVPPL